MDNVAFWFAISAGVIAIASFVWNVYTAGSRSEVEFLKTRVNALETDMAELRRENARQQAHIEECEGKTRDLQQEVLSLMRQVLRKNVGGKG